MPSICQITWPAGHRSPGTAAADWPPGWLAGFNHCNFRRLFVVVQLPVCTRCHLTDRLVVLQEGVEAPELLPQLVEQLCCARRPLLRVLFAPLLDPVRELLGFRTEQWPPWLLVCGHLYGDCFRTAHGSVFSVLTNYEKAAIKVQLTG